MGIIRRATRRVLLQTLGKEFIKDLVLRSLAAYGTKLDRRRFVLTAACRIQNKPPSIGRRAIRRPSSLGVTAGISLVSRLTHPVKDPAHGQISVQASTITPHWELKTT